MIKSILTKAKSAVSQPISQPAAEPPAEPAKIEVPQPATEPAPAPKPETILKAMPRDDRSLAIEAAKQVGLVQGQTFGNIKICRHQPGNHPWQLFAEGVPGWSERVLVAVKDARSWKPVNPPHDTLTVQYVGDATVDGVLKFQSADVCKANRQRRTPR
jgi:hypothetical protein